jgi:preprotein translocase subunit SecD
VAIVLEPTRDVDGGELDQSIEILRNRIDALGVAEPEITRQGDTIVVQLPGVTDREKAREVVGQTAELRFRPVLNVLPATPEEEAATTTTTAPEDSSTTTSPDDTSTTEGATTTEATTTTTAVPAPADDGEIPGTTPREEDLPDREVILPEFLDGEVAARYVLGPAELTGDVVDSADARFGGAEWAVTVTFTGPGSTAWDEMAARYVGQRIAIALDGVVISAPTIQVAEFGGTAEITGAFTEGEAKDLALVLRYGALPVELEAVNTVEVSATLGHDALNAGLVAGAIGVLLVGLYLIAYYRLLGVVVVSSLGVAGALLWSIIAYLGESQGLALTLAGVTGIVVSIGVAVDSNVVYYERIKEEVRSGKTLRSAVDQAFDRSFSTILKADTASLIGAGLLYWLTVGPVRGFAFFLGLATLLDIVVSWTFMRPAAQLLVRSRRLGRPGLLGIPHSTRTTGGS